MRKGFIALFSVNLIGAIALTIAIALVTRSINANRAVLDYQQGELVRSLSSVCVERAMQRLTNDLNYSGNEDIIINNNTCHINILGGFGNTNRTIQVVTTIGDYTKRFVVVVLLVQQSTQKPQISSWQEVSVF